MKYKKLLRYEFVKNRLLSQHNKMQNGLSCTRRLQLGFNYLIIWPYKLTEWITEEEKKE